MNNFESFLKIKKKSFEFIHYKLLHWREFKMDPYTATLQFLTSPVSQKFAQALLDIDIKFIGIIGDFISKIHSDLHKNSTINNTASNK